MEINKMRRFIILFCLLIIGVIAVQAHEEDHEPELPEGTITGYYSPCKGGTDAEIFSWHGINQDGKPPADLTRQAFHFLCENREIYAIYGGEVWGATQLWGGLILVDDADHETCMVYLGMESVEVRRGDVIETGDYLGQYLYRPHITVLDAPCVDARWYNRDARRFEIPVAFIEIGYVIAPDLHDHQSIPFVSQNPSGELADDE
jgi:hypothetical protein